MGCIFMQENITVTKLNISIHHRNDFPNAKGYPKPSYEMLYCGFSYLGFRDIQLRAYVYVLLCSD